MCGIAQAASRGLRIGNRTAQWLPAFRQAVVEPQRCGLGQPDPARMFVRRSAQSSLAAPAAPCPAIHLCAACPRTGFGIRVEATAPRTSGSEQSFRSVWLRRSRRASEEVRLASVSALSSRSIWLSVARTLRSQATSLFSGMLKFMKRPRMRASAANPHSIAHPALAFSPPR